MTRIPHPSSDTEVRQAFQRLTFQTDVITTGATGQVLVGAGVGVAPTWTTDLITLTSLTVDSISINAAVITSDTGAISFDNENLTTTGTIAGINVTSGADPGHTHTTGVSGIDISDDTNLAVTAPIVLTDDTLSLNQAGIDHGSIGGLGDDDHTIYLLASGVRALTGNMAVDALITIDGRDISVDGAALDVLIAIAAMVSVDVDATPGYLGAASNDGVLRTSTGISYADGGNFVTLTTNDGEIVHDNLSGYDANDHIDHTGVSISTSTGLTGGGDISSTRTLSLSHLGIESLTDPGGDRIMFWDETDAEAVVWLTVSTGLQTSGTNLTTKDSEIVHDNLSGYSADKHADHTGVSISTGLGLSGGGTIASTRTLILDINGLAADSIAAGDSIAFYDTTGGACDKITFALFEAALTHANLIGGHDLTGDIDHDAIANTHDLTDDIDHDAIANYDANKHVDHTGVTLTAGSGLTGTGDISASRTFDLDINSLAAAAIAAGDFVPFWDITATATNKKITFTNFEAALNHDSLASYVAAQHIDWTGAADNFSTAGTGTFTLSASDASGLSLDGDTNPFTTSGTSCMAMQVTREINQGIGDIADATILQAYIELTHTNANITAETIIRPFMQYVVNTGTITNATAATRTLIIYGIQQALTDTGTYNTSDEDFKIYWQGCRVTADFDATFVESGAGTITYSLTGLVVDIDNNPTVTGSYKQYLFGVNISLSGTADGTARAYGIYLTAITGCDQNWGIYDISGADWALTTDSQKIFFGGGRDASICYNGTNFVLDAQEVGTGHIVLNSVKTTTGHPAAIEGLIYWNTFDNGIFMYADSGWRTLVSW